MDQGLSMGTIANGINYNTRAKEEKRISQYHRDLLYLIADYLKNRGYTNSSNAIAKEAQLSESIQVCDNVDLEIILRGYDMFTTFATKKSVTFCKQTKSAPNPKVSCKTIKNNAGNKSVQQQKQTEDANCCINDGITVKPIFGSQLVNSASTVTAASNDWSTPISVSIEKLYGDDIEMRKIAEMISKEILMKDCNVRWDDVIGLDECKAIIKQAVIYPMKYPELFRKKFSPWKGLLMYGPSGTGKTMLAKAVATECKSTFFNVSASSLVSKWRGDSEKYIRALFDLAHERAPSVIFIDEIDWIATKEDLSEPARRFRAELLTMLDGLTTDENAMVVVLAATNAPWNMDSALVRRLEKFVHVTLPCEKDRLEMLLSYYPSLATSKKLCTLNKSMQYYSGAEIKMICKEAWYREIHPLIEQIENNKQIPSKMNIKYELKDLTVLQNILNNSYPTTQRQLENKYATWLKTLYCL